MKVTREQLQRMSYTEARAKLFETLKPAIELLKELEAAGKLAGAAGLGSDTAAFAGKQLRHKWADMKRIAFSELQEGAGFWFHEIRYVKKGAFAVTGTGEERPMPGNTEVEYDAAEPVRRR